uniref:Late embryogenesis abundant protein LEA-2 subgroup domain-containing protein n=2 Tax=Oryza brachyantha TaxID=4533 RepID=J3KUH0_ORYBR
AVDLDLALRLSVRNPGLVLPLRYRAVSAAVSYRGHLLGSAAARPGSGDLDARGTTYADAEVWVDAGRVIDDVIDLIGDLAAGSLPLEIVTEVVGAVRVFRFDIPVKGLISCSVNVSPDTQRIISQDCY